MEKYLFEKLKQPDRIEYNQERIKLMISYYWTLLFAGLVVCTAMVCGLITKSDTIFFVLWGFAGAVMLFNMVSDNSRSKKLDDEYYPRIKF